MNEKTHKVLDGEIARDDLSRDDAARVAEADSLIQSVRLAIPADPIPDLGPSVLRRIQTQAPTQAHDQGHRPARLKALTEWFWSPRPLALQWRPAYAFAVVALVAAYATLGRQAAPVATPADRVLVQFRLDAPDARQVQLAGNFTNWQAAVALKRSGAGVWTVVLPLEPGVHNYAFVVDGQQWMADPMAQTVSDGFGGHNSQLAVLPPDQRSL